MTEPTWVRSELMRGYYEREWGRLLDDDVRFFEFFCLEILQAGLSWETIIRKRDGMRDALDGFDFRIIAEYPDAKLDALTVDERVIRHRKKLEAIRTNARTYVHLTEEHGSFLTWLNANEKESLEAWVVLFKRTFSFMGPEIVREFLESSGLLDTNGSATIAFIASRQSASRK